MKFRTMVLITLLTALAVSTINRAAGWSEDFAYAFGLAVMAVMILICFPFLDPRRSYGRRSDRR